MGWKINFRCLPNGLSDTMNTTSKELAGQVALVTGASRGIGEAIAESLAARGAHVVITARTAGGLEELEDRIHEAGGSATIAPLDLTDGDSIARLASAIAALPPASWMRSSSSSSPPAVRAVITTCAPRAASDSAIASPMPRLAPVTSATWPASSLDVVFIVSDNPFGKQGKLIFQPMLIEIGQRGRIVAGKAGVAILRSVVAALHFAQRPVKAVDRDK